MTLPSTTATLDITCLSDKDHPASTTQDDVNESATLSTTRSPLEHFFAAECNRVVSAQGKRPKPTRSLLLQLREIETWIFSPSGPTRALDFTKSVLGNEAAVALFRTLLLCPSNSTTVVLKIHAIAVPGSGLKNEAIQALVALLSSHRCSGVTEVDLRDNEFVAVQAGQVLLRMLGFTLPHDRLEQSAAVTTTRGLGSLRRIHLSGTNIPTHYVRRIYALVAANGSEC